MSETEDKKIVFYCKDCDEIVDTNRVGKKYVYTCKKCGTKNVAFGTAQSIFRFFKIEDENGKLLKRKSDDLPKEDDKVITGSAG